MKFKILVSTLILAATCAFNGQAINQEMPNGIKPAEIQFSSQKAPRNISVFDMLDRIRNSPLEKIVSLDFPYMAKNLFSNIYEKHKAEIEQKMSKTLYINTMPFYMMSYIASFASLITFIYCILRPINDPLLEFSPMLLQALFLFGAKYMEFFITSLNYLGFYLKDKYAINLEDL